MILRDVSIILIVAVVLFSAAIGWGAAKYSGVDDGAIEEESEEVIEKVSGFDVDLTPKSKEVKK